MSATKLQTTVVGNASGDSRNVGLIFELAEKIRNHLNRFPFLTTNGRAIEGIEIAAAGTKQVAHGLGRKVKGYLILNASGSAPEIYVTANDERLVTLAHSGASTTVVSVWFF